MTKRKSKTVKDEAEELLIRLKEIQQIQQLAEQEEKLILDNSELEIKQICEINNLFCGVIITTDDLISIIKLAIDTKENIRIPFHLYYNE